MVCCVMATSIVISFDIGDSVVVSCGVMSFLVGSCTAVSVDSCIAASVVQCSEVVSMVIICFVTSVVFGLGAMTFVVDCCDVVASVCGGCIVEKCLVAGNSVFISRVLVISAVVACVVAISVGFRCGDMTSAVCCVVTTVVFGYGVTASVVVSS